MSSPRSVPESGPVPALGALRPAIGVHHAAYRCLDAEQTRWFYEDVVGLPLALAFVSEEVPGLGDKQPFMHLFFALGDGSYIAFFDQPCTALPEHFSKAHSFDRHIALEVSDEETLLAWQQRINAHGVSCLGPVDHGFVKSVYMYDPNGLQLELTVRTAQHAHEFAEGARTAHGVIDAWRARTREEKVARLGEAALDRRSRRVSAGS
jgi:catechol 2,3-dioxygenase-like lactoylglutathione lyase family enzyme